MPLRHKQDKQAKRRGAVAPLVAISCTVLIGFAALAVDVGMLYNVRAELQRTADSAALAAAWELYDQDRLTGTPYMADDILAARQTAADYAVINAVHGVFPTVDMNGANALDGDIVVGTLDNPDNLLESLSTADLDLTNAIQVTVRRDETRNGPISLMFANIFGISTSNITASATAAIKQNVVGYKIKGLKKNAGIMPLALHIDAWNGLLAGTWTTGDGYTHNFDENTVADGGDGILELNLYPGAGPTQLPPGNFGTVDIGSSNNSADDLKRQILYGVNEDDLAVFGGELKLGPDGTLMLDGDTGLSASIKSSLEEIIGRPRTIPLFDQVSGTGDNSTFRVVGFAGITIVNVKLTGAMTKKEVIIQPAIVIDDCVITDA